MNMLFSHHSHSGQFCCHAQDSLEEMVQEAIHQDMSTYCLTEHMPREELDIYPEELERFGDRQAASQKLMSMFDKYVTEAHRLKKVYASQITLLVGMEIDWIRKTSCAWIETLLQRYNLDFFIGSVHHVHGIPIDYDKAMYLEAREKSGSTDQSLAADYYDAQYDMLQALHPPVIGHFDLIRLKSDEPDSMLCLERWPEVWGKVLRNLSLIKEYDGIIEINTAALRKGLVEPYPQARICQVIKSLGIKITLSDDAHGVNQVGTNYGQGLEFLRAQGFKEMACLGAGRPFDSRFCTGVSIHSIDARTAPGSEPSTIDVDRISA